MVIKIPLKIIKETTLMKSVLYYINKNILIVAQPSFLFIAMMIITSFSSCDNNQDANTNKSTISFRASNTQLNTSESQIIQLEALLFVKDGTEYTFYYPIIANNLVSTGTNSTTFQLIANSEKRPVKIYFIANANTEIANSGIKSGDTETLVKQKIKYTYPSSGIITNLPMWGEYEFLNGISSDSPNVPISLNVLPAVARIDVGTTLDPSNFDITSIQAFRTNELIQVIPNSYTDNLIISNPSIPANSNPINTTSIAVTGNNSQSQLYIPESSAPSIADQLSKATCIIVGGKYNNSTTATYYRLDLEPPVPNYPKGQVLRDHLYTFAITSVSSPGWETPEEAANNKPTNIEVNVEDWYDKNMDIDLGGNYYLNVSSREILLADTLGSIGSSLMFTNVFDYTLQWCDASGIGQGATSNSLNDGTFNVVASRNVILVTSQKDNTAASTIREAYFLIIAKRTRMIMKIIQSN